MNNSLQSNEQTNFIQTQEEAPLSFDYLHFKNSTQHASHTQFTRIVIIAEGSILLTLDKFSNREIKKDQIFLISPGTNYSAEVRAKTRIYSFLIKDGLSIPDEYSIQSLAKDYLYTLKYNLDCLDVKPPISRMLALLRQNIDNGVGDEKYFKMKIEELLFLLRSYYSRRELALLFYPLFNSDSMFTEFVHNNHTKVKTVREFAELYGCSVSNFDKKFRKSFGTSVYKWMIEQKKQQIRNEICETNKPIKQIAEEYKFLSLPQFSDYCKKHLGAPPMKLRKATLGNSTKE